MMWTSHLSRTKSRSTGEISESLWNRIKICVMMMMMQMPILRMMMMMMVKMMTL